MPPDPMDGCYLDVQRGCLSGLAVKRDTHGKAESTLDFVIAHDGQILTDVPTYLGARGHLVALRDGDLAYLHVHADEERLSFEAEFPTPGPYRLLLQFRHDGEVRTAAFTVDVAEETR